MVVVVVMTILIRVDACFVVPSAILMFISLEFLFQTFRDKFYKLYIYIYEINSMYMISVILTYYISLYLHKHVMIFYF